MLQETAQTYYEILDVKPDATPNDIRQAYFRAKAAYSKDSAALYSLFDENETRSVLEMIEQAYLVLSNNEKRKEYDRVHGFLSSDMGSMPSQKKSAPLSNTFSFAQKAAQPLDPAQEAAKMVLGTSEGMPKIAETSAPAEKSRDLHRDHHEDYSTPRTLAAAQSSGPPVQEYHSPSSFSARENKLGIIRRIDLVKAFRPDPAMEDSITNETSFRGEFLKKVREYKGISVEELCEFTKISKTYINCIESEEFESLPAPAYLRGFVAQIAKALKLPHDKAATAYMAHYKTVVLK